MPAPTCTVSFAAARSIAAWIPAQAFAALMQSLVPAPSGEAYQSAAIAGPASINRQAISNALAKPRGEREAFGGADMTPRSDVVKQSKREEGDMVVSLCKLSVERVERRC